MRSAYNVVCEFVLTYKTEIAAVLPAIWKYDMRKTFHRL